MIHSLEGSKSENSQRKYVFPVKGCLFFGVPHQGAKLATVITKYLENLVKLLPVNMKNVGDLQFHSDRLERVSKEFETTRSNLDIEVLSFYENRILSQLAGLVSQSDI